MVDKDEDVVSEENENLLKLEIGKTKIGTKRGMYKGKFRELSIYYGNFVKPMIDGEFLTLNEAEYRKMLEDFLNYDDEGRQYDVPNEEEYKEAIETVQTRVKQYQINHKSENKQDLETETLKETNEIEDEKSEELKEDKKQHAGLSSIFGSGHKKPEEKQEKPIKQEKPEETKQEEQSQPNKETLELQEQLNKLKQENEYNRKALENANKQKQQYKEKLARANAPKRQRKTEVLFKAVSIMAIVLSILNVLMFFFSTYR